MELAEARTAIIELDDAMKRIWPDAWAMFVVTERGHIQFSLNRPGRWGLFTFDIPFDDADWLPKFHQGLVAMRDAIPAIRAQKEAEAA